MRTEHNSPPPLIICLNDAMLVSVIYIIIKESSFDFLTLDKLLTLEYQLSDMSDGGHYTH